MTQTAELKNVQQQLAAVKKRARTLVADISQEQLWQRPSLEAWSVGECLAHLNVAGQLYLERMKAAVATGWAEGKVGSGPFRYSLFFRLFLWYEEPPPRKKIIPIKLGNAAPELFAPPSQPNENVANEFATLQDEFSALTEKADGLDLTRVKMTSPAAERFRMSLLEAFGGILAHERRHLWQAEQVRAKLSVY